MMTRIIDGIFIMYPLNIILFISIHFVRQFILFAVSGDAKTKALGSNSFISHLLYN